MSLLTTDRQSIERTIDGVYVDSVVGVAGTAWPIGAPGMPVNNLTDAFSIAVARNLVKIVIANAPFGLLIPQDINGYEFIGLGYPLSYLSLNDRDIYNCVFRNLRLTGITTNYPNWAYDCIIYPGMEFGGYMERCTMPAGITLTLIDDSTFVDCSWGDVDGPRSYLWVDGHDIDLINNHGWLQLESSAVPGVIITVSGQGLLLDIRNDITAGTVNIYGDTRIIDNHGGTCTVNDYTNKPRDESPVNITAIVASETDFLNLSTAGFHYTIDDLVLKCADPGANTVNVRLYELVNGVLTNTQTFAITNANFATYFDINTMFGLKSLAGDNIRITVQATAGGPYAVTGSYCYRSA